jgi:hypothetical protein
LIEHAIRLDRFRVRVPQQRVANLVPLRKKLQDFFGVITDRREFDSLLFESRECALQLDQLSLAEWSPIRRAKKQKNGTLRSLQRIQSLRSAKLVA